MFRSTEPASAHSQKLPISYQPGHRTNIYNAEVRFQLCFFVRHISSCYAKSTITKEIPKYVQSENGKWSGSDKQDDNNADTVRAS